MAGRHSGRGVRGRPALLLRRGGPPARLRPRLRAGVRLPAAADDPFALRLDAHPGYASCTSTPRPRTATSATATSSHPA
ncbi:hypothetical protein NKG94_10935 [Micromonospora sp. M12]